MGNASTATSEKTDRRRHPRSPVNRPARISIADGPPAPAQLMNISPRGAALFCSTPVAAGTPVWLLIRLHANPKTVRLQLTGSVQQSHLIGESHLVRVLFTDPPRDAIRAILEFMNKKLAPGA